MGEFTKLRNNVFFSMQETRDERCIPKTIGNKCYNIQRLFENGFNVPKSIYLPIELHELYLNDDEMFNKCIYNIKNHLLTCFNYSSLAVRSSALLLSEDGNTIHYEDSTNFSMAGWFKSKINIKLENLDKAIKECYEFCSSDILQRNIKNHFDNEKTTIKIALLIQEFYSADKSAVIFTKNPYEFKKGLFLINATYGACKGIVSGEITGDNFFIDRESGKTVLKFITKKEFQYLNSNDEGLEKVEIGAKIQKTEVLNNNELLELLDICVNIEKLFNYPQDIEIILHNGKWVIVQTRPLVRWK